jgi:hypothetical protein
MVVRRPALGLVIVRTALSRLPLRVKIFCKFCLTITAVLVVTILIAPSCAERATSM